MQGTATSPLLSAIQRGSPTLSAHQECLSESQAFTFASKGLQAPPRSRTSAASDSDGRRAVSPSSMSTPGKGESVRTLAEMIMDLIGELLRAVVTRPKRSGFS
jgi:hypothetical protein